MGYGAQQPYGYGAQQAPGSAQHSAGQVYGQQTYEAEPVSMHAQHAAPKGNGGKTFLIAFAGALVACVLAFGVWGIAGAMIPGGSSSGTSSVVTDPSTGETTVIAPSEDPTLAEAVSAKCLPSVAAITVYADASQNDAMSQYFGYQYGGQSEGSGELVAYSQGSGVVLTEDGYIITNNHVVEGGSAYEVMVAGETYEADLVGTDPSSDVAVLKAKDASGLTVMELGDSDNLTIGEWVMTLGSPFGLEQSVATGSDVAVLKAKDASGLTVMELGDSDNLTIGEWVMTLGSPFGLEQSVATGIVSATSRSQIMSAQESMQSGGTGEVTIYPNMIQTDAAINPGNSGGALVDDEGKLIGINTLITSYSGNYSGVGFAIPVNYAINLAQQIIAGETPTHAQLGVSLSTVSAATASRYGLPVDTGAYVAAVTPDSGAAAAGIVTPTHAQLGVSLSTVSAATASRYGLPVDTGAYVAAVTPDSGAAAAGIVPGDIVTAFDGQAVESASDLMLDVRTKNPGDTVTLTVNSGGQEKEVQVTLGDDSASQKAKQEQQSQEQSMNGYSLEDLFGRQR